VAGPDRADVGAEADETGGVDDPADPGGSLLPEPFVDVWHPTQTVRAVAAIARTQPPRPLRIDPPVCPSQS